MQVPAPFEYERATSVDHAIGLLERLGSGSRLVAGGHSLLPMMKLRLATLSTSLTSTTCTTSWGTSSSSRSRSASAPWPATVSFSIPTGSPQPSRFSATQSR
jgi:hypothetical protein